MPIWAEIKPLLKTLKSTVNPLLFSILAKPPNTYGDRPGIRKGVVSRTVRKTAWPMIHSSSVKIRKRYIIRTGDMFHMNGKFKKRLPPKLCIFCKAKTKPLLVIPPSNAVTAMTKPVI
ncbi:PAAR-like domain-containing protein [Neisseria zalophi]|uniref:PAAR-like domain-containing protein n=1 Tax=Neisseria zalophi TaxID=640030 RepID=UPI001CD9A088|nr:PAAR-like domain-containing protein [Neisseria zalophi]